MKVIFKQLPIYLRQNRVVIQLNVEYEVNGKQLVGVNQPHACIVVNDQDVYFYLRDAEVVDEKVKAGDMVTCIDDAFSNFLRLNRQYLVKDVKEKEGKFYYLIAGSWYSAPRFAQVKKKAQDKPEEKKKEIPKLLQDLVEKVKNQGIGTCSYAIGFKKGEPRFQVHDVCHARLPWDKGREEATEVALCISGHYAAHPHKEAYLEFVDYVVNRSFFNDCFIKRPGKDIVNDGVMMNVEEKASKVYTAAIMLRTGSEYSHTMKHFKMLKDMGFSENVAYITSQFCRKGSIYENAIDHGHHIFCDRLDVEGFKNAINNKEFNGIENEKPYREQCKGHYDGLKINALFEKAPVNKTIGKWLMEKLPTKNDNPAWGAARQIFKIENDAAVVRIAATFSQILN